MTRCAQYFAFGAPLLDCLAHRLIDGSSEVRGLLSVIGQAGRHPALEPVTTVRFERSWVRFATEAERRATGALWVDCEPPFGTIGAARIVDTYTVQPTSDEQGEGTMRSPFELPPLDEHPDPRLQGGWVDVARAAWRRRRESASKEEALGRGGPAVSHEQLRFG